MGLITKIEWAFYTANLWHGCTRVHEGCLNCYACILSKMRGREIWGDLFPRYVVDSFFRDIFKFQRDAKQANEVRSVFIG